MNSVVIFLCLLVFLSACNETYSPFSGMNIVHEYGWEDTSSLMASYTWNPALFDTVEVITELSSQVVVCKIEKLNNVKINAFDELHYYYTVTIEEVLFDKDQIFKIGDQITVSSSEGILPANQAKALYENSAHAKKFGVLQGEYGENDYVRSSYYNGIPIQVGETYLMYLTDRYYKTEKVYSENGGEFLYLCRGNAVYTGREGVKHSLTLSELKNQISAQLELRTGRADEIGEIAYINELGEQQAAAARAAEE